MACPVLCPGAWVLLVFRLRKLTFAKTPRQPYCHPGCYTGLRLADGYPRESLLLFGAGWEFMNMNRVIELGAQDVGTLGRAYAAAQFCREKSAQFSDALSTLSGTRAATRTSASSRTLWSTAT